MLRCQTFIKLDATFHPRLTVVLLIRSRYAKARGVRVMVEIDTPGHTESWGVGYPDIISQCNIRNPPLDPTVNQV